MFKASKILEKQKKFGKLEKNIYNPQTKNEKRNLRIDKESTRK